MYLLCIAAADIATVVYEYNWLLQASYIVMYVYAHWNVIISTILAAMQIYKALGANR